MRKPGGGAIMREQGGVRKVKEGDRKKEKGESI